MGYCGEPPLTTYYGQMDPKDWPQYGQPVTLIPRPIREAQALSDAIHAWMLTLQRLMRRDGRALYVWRER